MYRIGYMSAIDDNIHRDDALQMQIETSKEVIDKMDELTRLCPDVSEYTKNKIKTNQHLVKELVDKDIKTKNVHGIYVDTSRSSISLEYLENDI